MFIKIDKIYVNAINWYILFQFFICVLRTDIIIEILVINTNDRSIKYVKTLKNPLKPLVLLTSFIQTKTNMDNNDEAFPSINPFFVDNVQCCYVERSEECSSCLFMKN